MSNLEMNSYKKTVQDAMDSVINGKPMEPVVEKEFSPCYEVLVYFCAVCGTKTDESLDDVHICTTCKEFYSTSTRINRYNPHPMCSPQNQRACSGMSEFPRVPATWPYSVTHYPRKKVQPPKQPTTVENEGHPFLIKNLLPLLEVPPGCCAICEKQATINTQNLRLCKTCHTFYHRARVNEKYLRYQCELKAHPFSQIAKNTHIRTKCSACRWERCMKVGLKKDHTPVPKIVYPGAQEWQMELQRLVEIAIQAQKRAELLKPPGAGPSRLS